MIHQSLEELEAELNRHQFHPVYLIMGPEEYLRRQAVLLLKQKVLSPDGVAFNYSEFSIQENAARQALEAAQTFPMMSARRLVRLTDVEHSTAADQELLLAYLDSPAARSVLLLTAEGELDRRTTFFRRLKEEACVVELLKLKGFALERWAERFFRSQGFRISQTSLKKAVDLAGEDLQTLVTELEKLLIYAGKEKVVPDSAVIDLISGSRQHTIFELTGALGRRDQANALCLLDNLIGSGEEPIAITTMVARHFRQILIAKDLLEQGRSARDAATAAQVPPFAQEEFMRHVRAIDRETAATMYRRLAEADYRFKSSPADKRMLLETLICSL